MWLGSNPKPAEELLGDGLLDDCMYHSTEAVPAMRSLPSLSRSNSVPAKTMVPFDHKL